MELLLCGLVSMICGEVVGAGPTIFAVVVFFTLSYFFG